MSEIHNPAHPEEGLSAAPPGAKPQARLEGALGWRWLLVWTRVAAMLAWTAAVVPLHVLVRALGKTSGVSVKELYQLFPKGPAKVAARIAGIPKPRGCI